MIVLPSGVARQHRNARDDLIALLPCGFSNLRYYKRNISDVLVYKREFQILDIISFPYTPKKNEIFNKFRGHSFPSLELRDIILAQCTYTHLFTGRVSKHGLHSLQSYGCVRITSWITLVQYKTYPIRTLDFYGINCFIYLLFPFKMEGLFCK